MPKKRIEYIDLAKGICILLVMQMHYKQGIVPEETLFDSFMRNLRMPLYFFLSGMFFKDYGSLILTAIKKFNRLIIPSILFLFIAIIMRYKLILNGEMLLFPSGIDDIEPWLCHNRVVWFLIALFWINILCYAIIVYIRKEWIRALIICSLPLLSPFVYAVTGNVLSTIAPFVASPFFYAGYFIRKNTGLLTADVPRLHLAIFIVLALTASIIIWNLQGYGKFSSETYLSEFRQIILYPISLLLILSTLALCKLIKHIPLISWFGRYSIIILGLHIPVSRVIFHFTHEMEMANQSLWILRFFIAIPILCIAIPVMTKCIPWLCAQKDLIPLPALKEKKKVDSGIIA